MFVMGKRLWEVFSASPRLCGLFIPGSPKQKRPRPSWFQLIATDLMEMLYCQQNPMETGQDYSLTT
jgi:hypothetical protein